MKAKCKTPLNYAYITVLIVGISACSGTIEAPEQLISIKQAEVLQQEFVQTRSDVINQHLGYEDTRDFWFSLETMENYIAYVKAEGAKKGYKDMGIRIYFAAYPKNMTDEKVDPGYSTVLLVPTTQTDSTARQGFFPMPPNNTTANGIQALNYGTGGIPPKDL